MERRATNTFHPQTTAGVSIAVRLSTAVIPK